MITKPACIAYITLGDGGLDYTLSAALALVQGGVDILEIGIPFSDPVADGPVIQKAMERSLRSGTTTRDALEFLRAFRKKSSIPVVLFSYYNPIRAAGSAFLEDAKAAGANGLLIVDLPYELVPGGILDPIFVATPSTTDERLRSIAQKARGFLYYACQKGTTGMRSSLPPHVPHDIARLRKAADLPIAIGFGISSRSTAQEALRHADAFVVGSYIVDAMARKASPEELTQLIKQIDPRRPL